MVAWHGCTCHVLQTYLPGNNRRVPHLLVEVWLANGVVQNPIGSKIIGIWTTCTKCSHEVHYTLGICMQLAIAMYLMHADNQFDGVMQPTYYADDWQILTVGSCNGIDY